VSEGRIRGIRGATTVGANAPDTILAATRELLVAMQQANGFEMDDVVSAIFTATADINAAFPAAAARDLGWERIPLLDAQEVDVPGALPRCVRILLHVYTAVPVNEIRHVYLGGAECLRPDLRKDLLRQ
jgi:chorismate mutase